jgi:aminoglycoside phosphotransferase family enzyme
LAVNKSTSSTRSRERTQHASLQDSPNLLRREGGLTLAEWLDLSWFYPDGFKKEKVLETDRSLIVFGESITYKFIKEEYSVSQRGTPASFEERWKSACEEVQRNRELAPDLYLGLRVLRWIDDEPHWITEFRGKDLNPDRVPDAADEVAIVMRRIPEDSFLSNAIEVDIESVIDQGQRISRALAVFHGKRERAGKKKFVEQQAGVLHAIQRRYVGIPVFFKTVYSSFLDPFSRTMLQELCNYLESFWSQNRDVIVARGRDGSFFDCHGRLDSECIAIESLIEEGRGVSIFKRQALDLSEVVCDSLSDLASLVIDLEARDATELAREIESSYFAYMSQGSASSDRSALEESSGTIKYVNQEYYTFLLIAEAIRQAESLFRDSFHENADAATKRLAIAFRALFDLRDPFLLVVGGSAAGGRNELADSLVSLTGARKLDAKAVRLSLPGYTAPEELLFDKILTSARESLEEGMAVVIAWPMNRSEERIRLNKLATKVELKCFLARCAISTEERVYRSMKLLDTQVPAEPGRRLWSSDSSIDEMVDCSGLEQMVLERGASLPELGVMVLQEFSDRLALKA